MDAQGKSMAARWEGLEELGEKGIEVHRLAEQSRAAQQREQSRRCCSSVYLQTLRLGLSPEGCGMGLGREGLGKQSC